MNIIKNLTKAVLESECPYCFTKCGVRNRSSTPLLSHSRLTTSDEGVHGDTSHSPTFVSDERRGEADNVTQREGGMCRSDGGTDRDTDVVGHPGIASVPHLQHPAPAHSLISPCNQAEDSASSTITGSLHPADTSNSRKLHVINLST